MFPDIGSVVLELTVAVLLMGVPAGPLAVATSVIVSDAPAARDANVIVRLLLDPPQTPVPVDEHETNVTFAGKLSVTRTELAVAGPWLVTVMA